MGDNVDQSEMSSYAQAGVDIERGNQFIDTIKRHAKQTTRPEVMAGIGGFASLFEIPQNKYKQPVLVSGTDGVGTKLKLALIMQKNDTIGIDLVAMCVNDIITQGAEPLFFLDYYATSRLQMERGEDIIKGIVKGCQQANMCLIGGETAEMPGLYTANDYDLAGFCVGIVEKDEIIDGSQVKPGDKLIALASSGPHSNGYSLIRKLVEDKNILLDQKVGDVSLGKALLEPTRIYVRAVQALQKANIPLHAIAHITGGGITDNLPRILPDNTCAHIDSLSWYWPKVFNWLQVNGNIASDEMYKTFNVGVGMILCIDAKNVDETLSLLKSAGEEAWEIGRIEANPDLGPKAHITGRE